MFTSPNKDHEHQVAFKYSKFARRFSATEFTVESEGTREASFRSRGSRRCKSMGFGQGEQSPPTLSAKCNLHMIEAVRNYPGESNVFGVEATLSHGSDDRQIAPFDIVLRKKPDNKKPRKALSGCGLGKAEVSAHRTKGRPGIHKQRSLTYISSGHLWNEEPRKHRKISLESILSEYPQSLEFSANPEQDERHDSPIQPQPSCDNGKSTVESLNQTQGRPVRRLPRQSSVPSRIGDDRYVFPGMYRHSPQKCPGFPRPKWDDLLDQYPHSSEFVTTETEIKTSSD